MECRIEENVLWVSGKLDSSTSPEFEAAIAQLAESLAGSPPQAVLEFSGIETLTSAPLRAMLTLAKRLHASKGSVVLAAPSPIAVEALKVSGFMRLQVFQIVGSLDDWKKSPAPAPAPQLQQPPRPAPSQAPQNTARPETAPAPAARAAPQRAPQTAPAPAPQRQSAAAPKPIPLPVNQPSEPGFLARLWRALAFWKR